MRRRFFAGFALVVAFTAVAVAKWQSRDSGSAVVAGLIVTDTPDPQPVRRATVRLAGVAGTSGRLVGTDDGGRFSFEALAAGTYTLSASKPGYVETFYGSRHTGRGPAAPLPVADGQRVDVTLRLVRGAVVTGLITDPQGNPAPGVQVTAVETRSTPGPALAPVSATTDDLGVYRLFGLAPADYLVSAAPQIVPADGRGLGVSNGAVPITTAAEVQWARGGGAGSASGFAAAAGAPPPGKVVAYAPVFYPGTTNPMDAAAVRLAIGEERSGVGIPLRIVPMSRLAGTLIDANGRAVTTATVALYPRRGAQPSPADMLVSSGALVLPRATVSAAGFVFTGVAPGEYTLLARTGAGQRGARPPTTSDEPVTLWNVTHLVIDGSDRTDLTLRLLPGATLKGSIEFERTTLVPPSDYTVEVTLLASNPFPGVAAPRAVMKNDTFTFTSIPPGTYVVRAGILPVLNTQSWTLKSAVANKRDLADTAFDADLMGDDIGWTVVTLTDRAAEVSGRLIDATNKSVTGYGVVVFTTDRSLWLRNARRIQWAEPAADGTFRIAGLPAGEYAIAAVGDAPRDLADPAVLSQVLDAAFRFTLAQGERRRQDVHVGK